MFFDTFDFNIVSIWLFSHSVVASTVLNFDLNIIADMIWKPKTMCHFIHKLIVSFDSWKLFECLAPYCPTSTSLKLNFHFHFSIAFSKRIKWHCWDDNENFIYIYVYICVFCVDMTFNTKCTHSYIKISAFYLDCIHEKGRAVLKKVNELIIFSSFFRKLLVVMASNL